MVSEVVDEVGVIALCQARRAGTPVTTDWGSGCQDGLFSWQSNRVVVRRRRWGAEVRDENECACRFAVSRGRGSRQILGEQCWRRRKRERGWVANNNTRETEAGWNTCNGMGWMAQGLQGKARAARTGQGTKAGLAGGSGGLNAMYFLSSSAPTLIAPEQNTSIVGLSHPPFRVCRSQSAITLRKYDSLHHA